jgi:transcriptional regulator with XRE-family HTH domain
MRSLSAMSTTVDELIQRGPRRLAPPEAVLCARIRRQPGFIEDDIAEAMVVDRATISRWETGTQEPLARDSDRHAGVLYRLAREVIAR